MKKLLFACFITLASLSLEAQIVAIVDFMKVPENGADAYLAVEKQWKTLHQNRVESGKIIAWELYYVLNSGSASPYNFVTVAIYENAGKTENQVTEDDFKKAFGDKTADLLKKTVASRSLVYSEMYNSQAYTSSGSPDKYIVINSVKTDNWGEYIDLEKKIYQPFHEEAIKLGKKNSWGVWSRWPNADNSIQGVVIDGYAKYEDIFNSDYSGIFEKLIAGKNAGEILDISNQINRTEEKRTFTKSEIWQVVDMTTPKK
jgi:hypothetical protein